MSDELTNSNLDYQEENEDKPNVIKKIFKKILPMSSKDLISAEQAWIESTYGQGEYKEIEERIEAKRKYILECIKRRFRTSSDMFMPSPYQCLINIEPDLRANATEIFRPFVEKGYQVINISECVSELKDEMIYYISWKHVFD
jgi:hypothetical protein